MKALALIAVALSIASCASTPEPQIVIKTVEVKVPVPTPCGANPGPRPAYPDTDAALKVAARDPFEAVKLLLAGRVLRIARENTLEAAVCR